MFVSIYYSVDAITLRIKNVAIDSKTMGSSVCDWRNLASKAKERNLLVLIVVL